MRLIVADSIVRNDEVVGSSPTSSTIFSSTYALPKLASCHTLSHKILKGLFGRVASTIFRQGSPCPHGALPRGRSAAVVEHGEFPVYLSSTVL